MLVKQAYSCRQRCLLPMWKSTFQRYMTIMGRIYLILYRIISKLHGFQLTSHFVLRRMFVAVEWDWVLKRGYTILFSVLGCSDPLSVRSVAVCLLLAAPLKTSLLRHGFYFHVTVVFSSVLRHSTEDLQLHCRNPACSVQQIPNTPYTLYTPYLFLVFAEYTPILMPILQRKQRC